MRRETASGSVARVALVLARASGLAVLVLGLLFWAGYARALITVHMALGVTLVLFVLPILGVVQLSLPSGNGYGLVRVLHLIVGLGAIAQAEALEPSRYLAREE